MLDPVIAINLDRAEACWHTALARASDADLGSPSGCPGWTNRELINHLVGGGLRYTKLLAQEPPEEVEATRGQDHLGEDPIGSFWVHQRAFRTIAGECDLDADVRHRIGPFPGHQLVRMRILELTLHAADLSRGTGHDWPIDKELAEYMSTKLADLIVDLGEDGGYARPRIGTAGSHAEHVLAISGR